MPDSSRITDIINRLDRIEDKQDRNFEAVQRRMGALEAADSARRGGLKVFVGMMTFLSTIAGICGSYLEHLWNKST